VQFLSGPSPIVPRMAEKDVPKVRQERSLLDVSRTGVSARTSAGVYATDEPAGDQRGLVLPPDPPPLLRLPPLLTDEA
jgi:hypothetical protein